MCELSARPSGGFGGMTKDQTRDLLLRTWAVQGLATTTINKRLMLLDKVGGVHATYDTVMTYLAGVSHPNTRRTAVSFLRTTFRTLLALDVIERDPMVLVPRPKAARWQPNPYTPDEVTLLENNIAGCLADWFTLALYAGLRACEITMVEGRWLRHTADGPMLRVKGKGGTDLMIPAHPKVVALLIDRCAGRLWPDMDAKLLSKQAKRAFNKLGVEGGIHRARHTFATRVLQASDCDLLVVRDLLRHASVATVQHYVSCAPNTPRRVLESIA